jgi:UDP-2,3-diacylglucosamine pyrophosphatase LpxH
MTYDEMIRLYAKYKTFDTCATVLKVNRKSFSKYWYDKGLPNPRLIPKMDYSNELEKYKIAVISDMHWGSKFQRMDAFNLFIEEVRKREIDTLLCAGDTIEGLMKRQGAEKERFLHSIDDIMEYVIEHYPEGFKNNILINGNHCNSLNGKGDGFDFAMNLCRARSDLKCISDPAKMVTPFEIDGGARVVLYHGVGACSQNLTTRTRNISAKLLNSCTSWDMLIAGHCHSSSIDRWLGKWMFSLDCFEDTTPYLAHKMLVPRIGGLILNYSINENGQVCNVIPENINYLTKR